MCAGAEREARNLVSADGTAASSFTPCAQTSTARGRKSGGCVEPNVQRGVFPQSRGASRAYLDPSRPLTPPLVPADAKVSRGAATCHPCSVIGEKEERTPPQPPTATSCKTL